VGDADAVDHLPLQTTIRAPKKGGLTCSNEQINAATIEGDLTVGKGDWCDLVDVTVDGDVRVHKTSGVRLENVDVAGDVKIEDAFAAADPLSAGANVICGSTIGGDLRIHASRADAPWRIGTCGPNAIGHDSRDHGHKKARHLSRR
jgi:hypothetical protein